MLHIMTFLSDSCLLAIVEFGLWLSPQHVSKKPKNLNPKEPPSKRQRIRETPGKGATEWTSAKPQKLMERSHEVWTILLNDGGYSVK